MTQLMTSNNSNSEVLHAGQSVLQMTESIPPTRRPVWGSRVPWGEATAMITTFGCMGPW